MLDWLALRGVNIPLAWVGYEYILVEVFRDIGLSNAEISSFLSGPAFQAWNRFGNIQGSWGGALPVQWINDQFALGKQIIARMYELGMTPVLPSFTGFVPRALTVLYPNASIVNGSQWSGFPNALTNVSFLEPFDPLFTALQISFIHKQQAAYGADVSHLYTIDQYNENDPYSGDLAYLTDITKNTFASLRAGDPEAIWLLQGWMFFSSEDFWTNERVEAYLGGAPGNDSMIILDLYAEAQPQWNRTRSYFGKQWVWCELHDYGGNMGLEGRLSELVTGPIIALNTTGSSMKGIGLTMEDQEGNEIVYDILLDQAWSATSIDIPTYLSSWVARRYLLRDMPSAAQKAWDILGTTVYNNTNALSQATIKSIIELSPALSGLVDRTGHHTTLIWYDTNSSIVPALNLLVQAGKESSALRANPEFIYDVVNVARQLLVNRFVDVYKNVVDIYNTVGSTAKSIAAASSPLIDIISDLDALLATNDNYLLSNWISAAKRWAGTNETYAAYLEYNARNQITLWGPDGEISDYASKQWAGLVGEYYMERWMAFVGYLEDSKTTGTAYNATKLNALMLKIGKEWDMKTWGEWRGETWGTKGDSWQMVHTILSKYA